MRKYPLLPIILFLILFIVGSLLYLNYKVNIFKLTDIKDWGAFGGYLSPVVSLCSLFLLGFISFYVHRQTLKLEQPLIIFKIDESRKYYSLKNVGKGAASNIILLHKNADSIITSGYKCYSLGQGDELMIDWKKGGHEWLALYQDVLGKYYKSRIIHDQIDYKLISNSEYKKNITQEIELQRIWNLGKEE